ncbi:MAG TPA: DUF6084 family protein [Pseudonocardiaceae bacterium]|jgi:hypothetical protein|nr:DUF6084 family protein [Pseudonocardiaceae bacterium]
MAELSFECLGARPDPYGTSPTLLFTLRITEVNAAPVHAIALRCQMRIEPQRRRYNDGEAELLTDLFGERARWGDTLKPMQFTTVSIMVPSFRGSTEIDLPVPVTYDLEVAAGKYFHALADGVVPMALMFSGTVFSKGETGFWVDQVSWSSDVSYPMPITVWHGLMDTYFPGEAWIRLSRDTVDELLRYKAKHAIPTWDAAMTALLKGAAE